jgi:hypothetical protein
MKQRYIFVLADLIGGVLEDQSLIAQKVSSTTSSNKQTKPKSKKDTEKVSKNVFQKAGVNVSSILSSGGVLPTQSNEPKSLLDTVGETLQGGLTSIEGVLASPEASKAFDIGKDVTTSLLPMAAGAVGTLIGGPPGTAVGAGIGTAISSILQGV